MGPNKIVSFFLKTAIAQIKKLDGDVFTPLNTHIGKLIQLNITSLFSGEKQYYLLIEKDHVAVLDYSPPASPNLVLTGKVADLSRLALELMAPIASHHSEWTSLLHRHQIQCYGDTALLQAFQQVIKAVDLDWSALWASVVGDKFAFPITQFFKKNKQFVATASQSTAHAIKEYLLYEKNCIVSGIEIEQWIEDIMILKNDTNRLEKNVHFLKARIEKLA